METICYGILQKPQTAMHCTSAKRIKGCDTQIKRRISCYFVWGILRESIWCQNLLYIKSSWETPCQICRLHVRKDWFIIERYLKDDDVMVSFGKKLKIAQNNLFTFVLHPGVPSTNNDTERSIRKCVMHRNVRDQAKSESVMRMLLVFLTCFETWRIRGQNMLSEMAKYI